jgi:hypothetical protein
MKRYAQLTLRSEIYGPHRTEREEYPDLILTVRTLINDSLPFFFLGETSRYSRWRARRRTRHSHLHAFPPPHRNNWLGVSGSNPRPILSPTTHQSSLMIPIILRVSAPEETARRSGHPRRAIAGKESYTNTERRWARSVVYRGAGRVGVARDSAPDSAHAQQGIRHCAPTILHNSLHDVVGERNKREGGLAPYTTVEACSEEISPARFASCATVAAVTVSARFWRRWG